VKAVRCRSTSSPNRRLFIYAVHRRRDIGKDYPSNVEDHD
jgi:hypothetical protein